MKSRYFAIFGVWALFIAVGAVVASQNRATKKQFADFRTDTVSLLKIALSPASESEREPTEEEIVAAYLARIADRIEVHQKISQETGAIVHELRQRRNGNSVENCDGSEPPSPLRLLNLSQLDEYTRSEIVYTSTQYSDSLLMLRNEKPPLSMRPFHAALTAHWDDYRVMLYKFQKEIHMAATSMQRGDKLGSDTAWNQLQRLRKTQDYSKADQAQKELDALLKIYPKLADQYTAMGL